MGAAAPVFVASCFVFAACSFFIAASSVARGSFEAVERLADPRLAKRLIQALRPVSISKAFGLPPLELRL